MFWILTVLKRLGVKGVEVRKPEQLLNVSSLIIPGGESTTMAKLAELHNLVTLLWSFGWVYKNNTEYDVLLMHAEIISYPWFGLVY